MSKHCQKAAMALAILAMVFRGLLPSGWMPNPAGFGQTALILCDMDGSMSAADMARMMAAMPGMDMPGDGKTTPASSHSHEECPFAAATHAGAATAALAIVPPELAVDHAHPPVPERSVALQARYQPQSPRAPPISA